jgi:hypothetical protein
MNAFILVWVLISVDGHSRLTYSPPLQTIDDCQRMQKVVKDNQYAGVRTQCVQLNILKAQEK